jgi:hypothetical protein
MVEKPPRNSTIFNGRRFWRRPRPKLGCGAEEEEEEEKKKKKKKKKLQIYMYGKSLLLFSPESVSHPQH